jgi:hypothetical protein
MRAVLSCLVVSWAVPAAAADMDFVTDRALCGLRMIDRHDRGMSFDGAVFSEIEYFCELAQPMTRPDWQSDTTHVSAGYCEEPGALFPGVFVLRTFQSEPGLLYLWQDETGTPTTFFLCES